MNNKAKILRLRKDNLEKIPAGTGVYIFADEDKRPLYIGKSVNLRARIKSHIKSALLDPKEQALVKKSAWILFYTVSFEYSALILEAQLIKKHQPPYNKIWKDDKSYLYIKITDEKYPKVYPIRQTEISKAKFLIGPFPSLRVVYSILKILRRIAPFCSQKKTTPHRCFYSKINLCSPCPNIIEKQKDAKEKKQLHQKYLSNIKILIKLLKGGVENIQKELETQLNESVKKEEFEKAIEIREKLKNLNRLKKLHFISAETKDYAQEFEKLKEFAKKNWSVKDLSRIECFDISNLGSDFTTASMVVMQEGILDKKQYRRFRAKQNKQSDTDQINQILIRRFKNKWQNPDLIVIDGGTPQLHTALKTLQYLKLKIPVIALAKKPDRIIFSQSGKIRRIKITPSRSFLNLIALLRDEAHRFAKKYHLHLRRKNLPI